MRKEAHLEDCFWGCFFLNKHAGIGVLWVRKPTKNMQNLVPYVIEYCVGMIHQVTDLDL